MKTIIFVVILLLLLLVVGCVEKITSPVHDDNGDFVYHIGPGDGLLGNVDLYIFLETMQGIAILLINGPGNPIGYQIRKDDIIFCQDSYIGSGGNTFQSGTSLPFNTWVNVNLVVYKSTFAGWLWPIGDLWSVLYNAIVDTTYEIEVMIIYDEPGKRVISVLARDSENIITIQPELVRDLDPKHQKIFQDHLVEMKKSNQ